MLVNKLLLDEVFVISRIIKVLVRDNSHLDHVYSGYNKNLIQQFYYNELLFVINNIQLLFAVFMMQCFYTCLF